MVYYRVLVVVCSFLFLMCHPVDSQNYKSFTPGLPWFDTDGQIINAHGGGILFHNGTYYWFGEHKGATSNAAFVGVTCYSSVDLYTWKNEGVALPVSDDDSSPIVRGCTIERPKVIYNAVTGKFVMYFHLELKGKGYSAAQRAVAVSDKPTGPYELVGNGRVNAGHWPLNMSQQQINSDVEASDFDKWWTPQWRVAIKDGLFVRRDFEGGQMARDMALFVDDDGKAYHIYSSEDNLTLHIAELTGDYLGYTGKYVRVEPGGHNEAPAIFKRDGCYFMITSGCTGWDPNAARLLSSDNIMGEWTLHSNPCRGQGAELTFNSQSTFIVPVAGKKGAFIFMADRWQPKNPIDGRYVWLPVLFENNRPELKWFDKWDLSIFEHTAPSASTAQGVDGYELVWSDEFDLDGKPDSSVWSFENGFVRNNELQWYQEENAECKDGVLKITARREKRVNPLYGQGSSDWRKNRELVEFTSSSINTSGKREFQYGRFEVRARIPEARGAWPAIWTLGRDMEWPSNGEIDIMEFYRIGDVPHILANTAWGTEKRWSAKWNSKAVAFSYFTDKDPLWIYKYHVWRMDWDEEAIRIYLDDELIGETLLVNTINGSLGEFKNPFKQPHYLLLNLAIGGQHGGVPDIESFPLVYEIDYVRVYQKK
jgi:beta-glucanase (GH16 family)